jgi:DNA invertase Pin-like site-specific DNA recombinase
LIAGLESFCRSLIEFARTLEEIRRRGVFLHVCNVGGGVFDPSNPLAPVLTEILIRVAQAKRSSISTRTIEGLAEVRSRGQRYTRHAPLGWTWQKRKDPRTGRKIEIMVPCEKERALMRHVVELRAQGYSLNQIREHLSYELKTGNRGRSRGTTGAWCARDVSKLIARGVELLEQERQGIAATPVVG